MLFLLGIHKVSCPLRPPLLYTIYLCDLSNARGERRATRHGHSHGEKARRVACLLQWLVRPWTTQKPCLYSWLPPALRGAPDGGWPRLGRHEKVPDIPAALGSSWADT